MKIAFLSFLFPALLGKTVSATESSNLELLKLQFDAWTERHDKAYENDVEYTRRLAVFAQNLELVSQHNEGYELGHTSYAMSVDGPFADLTNEEFDKLYLMQPQNCSATHTSSGPLPRRRDKTYVTMI